MISGEENDTVKLPPPILKSSVSLEQAIYKRRSVRAFSGKKLTQKQIGQLLWAAQGITAEKGNFPFRAAPSAGALYPMEIFAAIPQGVYQYVPEEHEIKKTGEGDKRKDLASAALGQRSVSGAPLIIAICSVYPRITGKYGERGIRYAHIEAGHIAQNIHLQALSLGLVSVPVGAFNDEKVSEILNLPEDCAPLYLIPTGYPLQEK